MKRIPVSSSGVRSVGYNPASMTLEVEFQSGDLYRYQQVPRSKYHSLMNAESKGAFFNAHIRDRYPTVKIEFFARTRHGKDTVRLVRKRISVRKSQLP